MTEPVANKFQLSGYTGVQAGVIKSPTDNAYLNSGAIFGGEANYKGTFLRGQIEAGTALGAKLEIGHTFDIGRNMGLELSAKTQINKSLVGNNTFKATSGTVHAMSVNITDGGNASIIEANVPAHSDYSTSWKGGESRTGFGAKLTFGSEKAKFGVGIEAGTRCGNKPNMIYQMDTESTFNVSINGEPQEQYGKCSAMVVNANNSSFYATPTVQTDIKLNKNLSFNANADLQQGHIGIRWNF